MPLFLRQNWQMMFLELHILAMLLLVRILNVSDSADTKLRDAVQKTKPHAVCFSSAQTIFYRRQITQRDAKP